MITNLLLIINNLQYFERCSIRLRITISTTIQSLKSELKRRNYSRDNIPDMMMWQLKNDGQIKVGNLQF